MLFKWFDQQRYSAWVMSWVSRRITRLPRHGLYIQQVPQRKVHHAPLHTLWHLFLNHIFIIVISSNIIRPLMMIKIIVSEEWVCARRASINMLSSFMSVHSMSLQCQHHYWWVLPISTLNHLILLKTLTWYDQYTMCFIWYLQFIITNVTIGTNSYAKNVMVFIVAIK